MVVDDEPDNLKTVKTILEANKYNVMTAITADDCLEQIENQKKPHLILMDIMMPGTPVKEIVPKLKGIPVSYLSVVRLSEAEKEELMKPKNVVDFIQKPFDINDLLKKIKKILHK